MVRFIYVFIKDPKVFFILHIDVWSKPLFRNQRKSNAYNKIPVNPVNAGIVPEVIFTCIQDAVVNRCNNGQ